MEKIDLGPAWRHYCCRPQVRQRLLEYLGGRTLEDATCFYVTSGAPTMTEGFHPLPVTELWNLLTCHQEAARSLWDRQSLLVHLDVEHVHFERPWASYLDSDHCHDIQKPLVAAIHQILGTHGINPLHLLTGRGHHFVWRIRRGCEVFDRLARLGRPPPSLTQLYTEPQRPVDQPVDPELGKAFAGLGRVMEFLGHRLLRAAAADTPVPLQLTAVEAGPVAGEREIVSIDISEYGDPLHTRMIRLPFSAYLKAHRMRPAISPEDRSALPLMVTIPLGSIDETQGLRLMRDLQGAAELARSVQVAIPDASRGMFSLLADYETSALARFHHEYDNFEASSSSPPAALPPCAQRLLDYPNDLLLKPAGIQHLVRVLLALGWHPRQIAELIDSKYRQDHGWVQDLHFHETSCRAEFYTRLFAGLFATGRDDLVDFNCRSAQEKRYCETDPCGQSLDPFRDSLMARRKHGRLASWPVNGLFLQHQHL